MKKRGAMEKLTSRIIIKKLEKEKNKLKERGVKKIGLFGSYAKGKQKDGSDIDILVTFDKIDFDNYLSEPTVVADPSK